MLRLRVSTVAHDGFFEGKRRATGMNGIYGRRGELGKSIPISSILYILYIDVQFLEKITWMVRMDRIGM